MLKYRKIHFRQSFDSSFKMKQLFKDSIVTQLIIKRLMK
jgi:hypothetical protein